MNLQCTAVTHTPGTTVPCRGESGCSGSGAASGAALRSGESGCSGQARQQAPQGRSERRIRVAQPQSTARRPGPVKGTQGKSERLGTRVAFEQARKLSKAAFKDTKTYVHLPASVASAAQASALRRKPKERRAAAAQGSRRPRQPPKAAAA